MPAGFAGAVSRYRQADFATAGLIASGLWLALGSPDRNDPVNNYHTEREAVEDFTKWFD